MKTILSSRGHHYMKRVSLFLIAVTLIAGMVGCSQPPPSQNVEIRDWNDLDAIRNNLGGSYLLMDDLNSTKAGYDTLVHSDGTGGEGWEPIGTSYDKFTGTFNGQGYDISNLFINRPDEDNVGLFGYVSEGVIKNVGVVDPDVTGGENVGVLVGYNWNGIVESDADLAYSNNCAGGSVTGEDSVGGLVGRNRGIVSLSESSVIVFSESWRAGGLVGNNLGTVLNCRYNGSVAGSYQVGGLVGLNTGLVGSSDGSYIVTGHAFVGGVAGVNLRIGGLNNVSFEGDVISNPNNGVLVALNAGSASSPHSSDTAPDGWYIGGLVGLNEGTVDNSYFTGRVNGDSNVGGLVGYNDGTLTNSHYNYNEVLINGEQMITIGALFADDFEQWLAEDKSLDVNERLSTEDGYYLINNNIDFKKLLSFSHDGSLKFRLKTDLDLGNEVNFYIPYLAGEFDGNGHTILNLNIDLDFVSQVGLFGYLAPGGKVTQVGVENVNITGSGSVGGLVGSNNGTVTNSYATGSVIGEWDVGGLVGANYYGSVTDCSSSASVAGTDNVGGLVGANYYGGVTDSCSTASVTGNYSVDGFGGLEGRNYGGLVGWNYGGTVSSSFWDIETSGQTTSAGGTGKTTAEMKSIATFAGAAWDIIAVSDLSERNSAYIWNIVDNETYPFLSWQPVP